MIIGNNTTADGTSRFIQRRRKTRRRNFLKGLLRAKSTNSTKSKKKGNEEEDEDEEQLKLSASNIKRLGKR